MTTIGLNSSQSTFGTKLKEEKQNKKSISGDAVNYGVGVGLIADTYFNASKHIPKSYGNKVKYIKENLNLLSDENGKKVKEALESCNRSLTDVVNKKEKPFWKAIKAIMLDTEIRDDSESALKPLKDLKLSAKDGLSGDKKKEFEKMEKVFSKLAKIGEKSDPDGFLKNIFKSLKGSFKFAAIGGAAAFVGMLGYNAVKGSKPE